MTNQNKNPSIESKMLDMEFQRDALQERAREIRVQLQNLKTELARIEDGIDTADRELDEMQADMDLAEAQRLAEVRSSYVASGLMTVKGMA
jgi:predicted nuclease with TOPRIM domain